MVNEKVRTGFLLLLILGGVVPFPVVAQSAPEQRVLLDADRETVDAVELDGQQYTVYRYHNYLPYASGIEVYANGERVTSPSKAREVIQTVAWKGASKQVTDEDVERLREIRSITQNVQEITGPVLDVLNAYHGVKSTLQKQSVMGTSAWDAAIEASPSLDTFDTAMVTLRQTLKDWDETATKTDESLSYVITGLERAKAGKDVDYARLREEFQRARQGMEELQQKTDEIAEGIGEAEGMSREIESDTASVPVVGGAISDQFASLSNRLASAESDLRSFSGTIESQRTNLASTRKAATSRKSTLTSGFKARQSAQTKVYGTLGGVGLVLLLGVGAVFYKRRRSGHPEERSTGASRDGSSMTGSASDSSAGGATTEPASPAASAASDSSVEPTTESPVDVPRAESSRTTERGDDADHAARDGSSTRTRDGADSTTASSATSSRGETARASGRQSIDARGESTYSSGGATSDGLSARTWLVALPVLGGVVAGGLGFVIPGLSAGLLGVAGLGSGAALAILLVYLATKQGEQSDVGRTTPPTTDNPGPSSTTSNAPLDVLVTDAVTGTPATVPVEVTAEQTFIDERQQVVVEDGRCTFELQTLSWTITASHAGRSATTEVTVGDADRVELTLPPKRVSVAVEDRGGEPLPDAEVSCTTAPVDASRVAADADSGPGVHVLEVPTGTERAMLVVDHEDYDTERADVLLADDPTTETTVTLERPASEQEVPDRTDDVEETDREQEDAEREPADTAEAEQETVETESPFAVSKAQDGVATADDPDVTDSGDPGGTVPERGGGGHAEQGGTVTEREGGAVGSGASDERPEAESKTTGESTSGTSGTGDDPATDAPEAARTPIPDVGVTGIDNHTPAYSPNPARIDLNADVIASIDEEDVVAQREFATVSRVEVADRTVAVKRPGSDGEGTDVVTETVERADEWRDVDDHPNVATLVDASTEPEPYLAVEFVERTLADADLPFDETPGLWHAVRLADAVAHAHRNRVFHLAIKPSNVLLESVESNAWPVLKLTDWDLPRHLDLPHDVFRPYDDEHAAPEQVWSDEFDGADERTDVYQLGVLTYELLTGDPPMDGRHALDRGADSVGERIPAVTDQRSDLPGRLDRILQNATAVRKADRYSSAEELRDELRSVAKSEAGGF